jgi:hypothetical protein
MKSFRAAAVVLRLVVAVDLLVAVVDLLVAAVDLLLAVVDPLDLGAAGCWEVVEAEPSVYQSLTVQLVQGYLSAQGWGEPVWEWKWAYWKACSSVSPLVYLWGCW